jgi:leucyl aminopeptidase
MKIEFVGSPAGQAAIAVLVFDGDKPAGPAAQWDQAAGGALTRAMASGRFTGAKGQSLVLPAPAGIEATHFVAIGAGKKDAFDDLALENAAGSAYAAIKTSGAATLALDVSDLSPAQAARAAFAVRLGAYRFDKYRTTEKPEAKPSVTAVQVITADPSAAAEAFKPLNAIAEAVYFSRDLVTEPSNVLYPEEYARRVKALEQLGLEVEVLGEAEMSKLGMNTLLCVGQGSRRESKTVIMRWNGAPDSKDAPIAFIGKGVTFDTGGISIKPAEGMEDMKFDMGGSAAVVGLMHALAGRKARVNAVGLIGLVENMPDGNAIKPGDVVTSLSGQTVEVINTDAEGRLVLADVLWYAQDRFKPRLMVDLATLTGAMIIALGHDYAGCFSNDDKLSDQLIAASKGVGEHLWRMPLVPMYEKQIESEIADVKNTGGRPGGSITAALFLQKFVNGVPWAHLDIAPTAWRKNTTNPVAPQGASGYGVRLLDRFVADNFES